LHSVGTILVYHLWLGELRGVFPTVSVDGDGGFVRGVSCDPFGLYVAVGVGRNKGDDFNGFINEVEIFEIGTGNGILGDGDAESAGDDSHSNMMVAPSANFKWSSCASKIAFACARGNLDIRILPGFIVANCYELRRKLRANEHFWATFPMYVNMTPEMSSSSSRSKLRGTNISLREMDYGGKGMGTGMMGEMGTPGIISGNPTYSRMSSKTGFSITSELSNSASGTSLNPDFKGIPKMGEGSDSQSTLFGRHSSASSATN